MIYGNVYANGHSNNSLFENEDLVHRYNPTYTPRLLREAFLKHGIEINTADKNVGREVLFELHIEGRPLYETKLSRYLISLENPNINKLNSNPDYCKDFSLVFAWDKRLFNLPNIVPIMIPHPLVHEKSPSFSERNIFSCLINANKAFKQILPSDLYLERIKTIKWYERHALNKFNLYGMGWDKETPAFTIAGRIKRSFLKLNNRLRGQNPFPSYQGEVKDKGNVLRQCKFSYCYENVKNLSNYITEKIFDSMIHGCVPIYWGADNISEHIPETCFIDRRKFKDTAAVHAYLQNISTQEYDNYQKAISIFINSQAVRKFSSEYFVSIVVDRVIKNLKLNP